MKNIDVIFVSPEGFIHDVIGEVVRKATNFDYAHVALRLDLHEEHCIVEMIAPHITKAPPDKYDLEKQLLVMPIGVSDSAFENIEKFIDMHMTNKTRYSLASCLAGGVADELGCDVGNETADHWADRFDSMDCSELATRVIRFEFPFFMSNYNPKAITPAGFFYNFSRLIQE